LDNPVTLTRAVFEFRAAQNLNCTTRVLDNLLVLQNTSMFVDVGLYLYNGERSMMRIMVIRDRDGKWYVHPDPSASPLLSDGLNEEKASVLDLIDVYELEGLRH
jgi:hypothetical protein